METTNLIEELGTDFWSLVSFENMRDSFTPENMPTWAKEYKTDEAWCASAPWASVYGSTAEEALTLLLKSKPHGN